MRASKFDLDGAGHDRRLPNFHSALDFIEPRTWTASTVRQGIFGPASFLSRTFATSHRLSTNSAPAQQEQRPVIDAGREAAPALISVPTPTTLSRSEKRDRLLDHCLIGQSLLAKSSTMYYVGDDRRCRSEPAQDLQFPSRYAGDKMRPPVILACLAAWSDVSLAAPSRPWPASLPSPPAPPALPIKLGCILLLHHMTVPTVIFESKRKSHLCVHAL